MGYTFSRNGVLSVQWILQDFEDSPKLEAALAGMGIPFSRHKLVAFTDMLHPAPVISDPASVILFGSYAVRRFLNGGDLKPGVFEIAPFLSEMSWRPYLLNGPDDAILGRVRDLPYRLAGLADELFFVRPVMDSKELAGVVLTGAEIVTLCEEVMATPEGGLVVGTLRPDTEMMLTSPVVILKEWRVWIVEGRPVAWSLYKSMGRSVQKCEIDEDVLAFATDMAAINPRYSPAYVMDVCRTEDGLKIIETNCVNAAGFYAADLPRIIEALELQDNGVHHA